MIRGWRGHILPTGLGASLLLAGAFVLGCHAYPCVKYSPTYREHGPRGDMQACRATVEVFFATDRAETGATQPHLHFGVERSPALTYGVADVTVPMPHCRGRWFDGAVDWGRNPANSVVLQSAQVLDADRKRVAPADFLAALHERVALSADGEVLIYVHGYAATFEDATRDAAQIAHDTDFDGAVIAYSWPTQGLLLSYLVDATNADWTVPYFVDLLEMLIADEKVQRIHILGHSMGCRIVARGIRDLMAGRGSVEGHVAADPPLGQIILAAADIDGEIFERDYMPHLVHAGERTTIYISEADWALGGSQRLHKYARLGQGVFPELDLAVAQRLEVIDVTPFDKGLVGHFYYARSPRVLADIALVLAGDLSDAEQTDEQRRRLKRNFFYRMQP